MRDIGLHIRLIDTVAALAQKAVALRLPLFQLFFLHQTSNRLVQPSKQEVADFLKLRSQFKQLFVHASYWTNFASVYDISLHLFKKELLLAKRLAFDYIVLHPGSARGGTHKIEGIDALVRRLNSILKYEHDIKILLENSAHRNLSIGGNLDDFRLILEKSDYPEKISFCLDTAHAHVFGYSLATAQDQQHFFDAIEHTIGFSAVALIHLNNTNQSAGSCIDKHVVLQEGLLSLEMLQSFVLHETIAHIPLIMELPIVDEQMEKDIVDLVRSWHAC